MKQLINKSPYSSWAPILNLNYFSFLSSWIANLGVVPLLTLAAFLFAPIRTFFLDLLFFVTRVFDTMIVLPIEHISKIMIIFYFNKHMLLPRLLPFVKVHILVFTSILSLSYDASSKETKLIVKEIILARGQHYEITDLKLDNYTIGNKEVISHKYNPKLKKIILRGKMLGFSEILTWKKSKKTGIYKIYVFSKKKQLNLLSLASSLKNLNLQVTMNGEIISIKGKINNIQDYLLYKKILKGKHNNVLEQITLSRSIKNIIIGEVYYQFYNDYIDDIFCVNKIFSIHCFYSEGQVPNKASLKMFKEEYGVIFFVKSLKNKVKNYKIKLKLIQIEKLGGKELNFGLSHLSTNLSQIMNQGLLGAISTNEVKLRNHSINMTTLAEPNALLTLGTPLIIKIGDNMPYLSNDKNQKTKTLWKFAGLQIKISLKRFGNSYKIKYSTKINKPGNNNSISGSEETAEIFINLGKPIELFSIGYKTSKITRGQFPLISKIPILGNLFKSKNSGKNYKKISGIILLEEI